jgi:hypothetical protein
MAGVLTRDDDRPGLGGTRAGLDVPPGPKRAWALSFFSGRGWRGGRIAHPQRQVCRGQHLLHHAEQVSAQHLEIDLFAQLDGKPRDHPLGVVPGPVEPPLNRGLHLPAQRGEQRRVSRNLPRRRSGIVTGTWIRTKYEEPAASACMDAVPTLASRAARGYRE